MSYRLLLIVFFPFVFFYTLKIAIRYRCLTYFLQRLGFFYPVVGPDVIWLHCASVGEVNTAIPLVKLFVKHNPDQRLVLTTTTPTGAKIVSQNNISNVVHCYLPVDMRFSVRRFLKKIKPQLALIMETELWPELYRCCQQFAIPITIINGRLSNRTLKANTWLKKQYKLALARVDHVLARSEADKKGFIELGCEADKIEVPGNLKFACGSRSKPGDITGFTGRHYVLAASTHDDEELQLAHLWKNVNNQNHLLVIVPRHPERGREIFTNIQQLGMDVALRSNKDVVTDETQIYIADTLGELVNFMATADIVFMGGSLVKHGGQNILEPARLAKPIIIGPSVYNFQQEVDLFLSNNACIQVNDVDALTEVINNLLNDRALGDELGARAAQLMVHQSHIAETYRTSLKKYYKDYFL
ncbi:MAG: 3-deoxy-D-manno-octulosonic acid transferase [Gammaproteobacteria bacterium]|nr:3-deoxy-D-manno-octulosonic acid transferase [Gammaproteobacteria bacterium]MDH5736068.1 3-deoxy-D-manno-octulosonic acid transferase [Gammaproteobacteria bacterium]